MSFTKSLSSSVRTRPYIYSFTFNRAEINRFLSTNKILLEQKAVTSNHNPSPTLQQHRSPNSSPLKVWPFVAIFAIGSYLFTQIVKSRQGTAPANANRQLSAAPRAGTK
ncbi:hypothetical protein M501DRAFT_1012053 [Patellaria atrata CBS 101060]|uniref:Uncharacterized protein n=1 Tax=Patellaria atrata CBS 101060 TaxID=1346257 RepID=A0A9P4VR82_9PEZI|nr:hypothetical protein M501DRAFT_1012053 [Patellaria atrata CBS 101060]